MLPIAVVLFAVAATGGVILASRRFAGKRLPLWLAVVHGTVGLTGVVLVALVWLNDRQATLLLVSVAVFALAGMGGAVMLFGYHLRGRLLPAPLVLLHASAAITAVVLVLVFLL